MAINIDDSAIEKLLRDAREEALTDAGLKITARAQQEAPVRTGNLRRNITFNRPTGPMRYASVDSNAPYSVYVHEGTRYQSANPYLARAAEAVSKGGA